MGEEGGMEKPEKRCEIGAQGMHSFWADEFPNLSGARYERGKVKFEKVIEDWEKSLGAQEREMAGMEGSEWWWNFTFPDSFLLPWTGFPPPPTHTFFMISERY